MTDLHPVALTLCDLCLDGKGGECHTPGCALWLNRAPDLPIRNRAVVEVDAPLSDDPSRPAPFAPHREPGA